MARCVAQALAALEPLVIEAGTGTGKTFAYLVPALLSGRHVIISTGTRTLQDQLYHRDLPAVSAAIGRPVKIALLKGRANYLCRHRLELARSERELPLQENGGARAFERIAEWSRTTRSGDISELSGLGGKSPRVAGSHFDARELSRHGLPAVQRLSRLCGTTCRASRGHRDRESSSPACRSRAQGGRLRGPAAGHGSRDPGRSTPDSGDRCAVLRREPERPAAHQPGTRYARRATSGSSGRHFDRCFSECARNRDHGISPGVAAR